MTQTTGLGLQNVATCSYWRDSKGHRKNEKESNRKAQGCPCCKALLWSSTTMGPTGTWGIVHSKQHVAFLKLVHGAFYFHYSFSYGIPQGLIKIPVVSPKYLRS